MSECPPTPHRKYLTWANYTVGLKGKDVLEIGGCSPVAELQRLSPKSWTCVDLNSDAVAAFNEAAARYQLHNFSATVQDAATVANTRHFSVAYSINAFEHIADLATTLRGVRESLLPGGVLFTVFGPIWSSDIGHHLSIPTANGPIGMFDGILEPWEHITSTPAQILERIKPSLGAEVSERVVQYVFRYPDLNRLSESDYISLLQASRLDPILLIRRKSAQRPPTVACGRTREFLWVLKNGAPAIPERLRVAFGFASAFALTRARLAG